MTKSKTTSSAEETIELGKEIGKTLKQGDVVCLKGTLGAGKTTLIKGMVASMANLSIDEIDSPTFVYLNVYEGQHPVYHFDLYRLTGTEDFIELGFEEYLYGNGVTLIEWPDRIDALLPAHHVIELEHTEDGRKITHICP